MSDTKEKIVVRIKRQLFGTEAWVPVNAYRTLTLQEVVQFMVENYDGLTSEVVSEDEVQLLRDGVVIGKVAVENE